MDLLVQAATTWKDLTSFHYSLTYGLKKQLHTIDLSFSPENFSHPAGFQYMKDIAFPNYSAKKLMDKIIDGKIKIADVQKSCNYEEMVLPMLLALSSLKESLSNDFTLYTYNARQYPFYTRIIADYLIQSSNETSSFVFLVQNGGEESPDSYHCCSIFEKGINDFSMNQKPLK